MTVSSARVRSLGGAGTSAAPDGGRFARRVLQVTVVAWLIAGCSSDSAAGPLLAPDGDAGVALPADYDATMSFGLIVLRSSTDEPVRIRTVEAVGGTNHESIELGGVLVADESRGIAFSTGGIGFPPPEIRYELSSSRDFVWTPELDAEENSRPVGLELMLEVTLRRPGPFAVIDEFSVEYVLESDPDRVRRLRVTGRALLMCGPEIAEGDCSPELAA